MLYLFLGKAQSFLSNRVHKRIKSTSWGALFVFTVYLSLTLYWMIGFSFPLQ